VQVRSLRDLGAHRPGLPPPALLVPLGNGTDGVLKGGAVVKEDADPTDPAREAGLLGPAG